MAHNTRFKYMLNIYFKSKCDEIHVINLVKTKAPYFKSLIWNNVSTFITVYKFNEQISITGLISLYFWRNKKKTLNCYSAFTPYVFPMFRRFYWLLITSMLSHDSYHLTRSIIVLIKRAEKSDNQIGNIYRDLH